MRNTTQFFAIIRKMGRTKEEIVSEFTDGRTESLSALTDREFAELMALLQQFNTVPPGDQMRKKMISLARQMNWGKNTAQILQALDAWLLKQKFQKTLMQLDVPQLATMLTIFETKVYKDYLTALNK